MVTLWNYNTGELLVTLRGHEHVVTGVAIAPDGKTIGSGDKKGVLCFWELGEDVLRRASAQPATSVPAVPSPLPGGWPNHPKTIETSQDVSIIVTSLRSVTRGEVVDARKEVLVKVREAGASDGSEE